MSPIISLHYDVMIFIFVFQAHRNEKHTIDDIASSTTVSVLQTFAENQKEMMRQAKEESAKSQEKDVEKNTYVLPSVLGYNHLGNKHQDEDSDSDGELFLMDNCDECKTIRNDIKQKTKVCVLM